MKHDRFYKFIIIFGFLYVTHAIASENSSKASESFARAVKEKLEKIQDPELLSQVLKMASTQDDSNLKLTEKHKRHLRRIGIFNRNNTFVSQTVKDILALQARAQVKPSDETTLIKLRNGKKVSCLLVDEITQQLKFLKSHRSALYNLGGYATKKNWALNERYFYLFIKHGILNKTGRFKNNEARWIIACSIDFKPQTKLVSPIAPEEITNTLYESDGAWPDKIVLNTRELEPLESQDSNELDLPVAIKGVLAYLLDDQDK